ncbi:MAG: hypothetical protein J7642_00665, partial [Cyanobacteria bacterium SBC]|nr:hypothetical protein [Cyanobacteria bacterium SBC]
YAIPYCIEFKTTQKSTIVNIALSAEDFYGGWIDEKHDGLSPLLPLYDNLLKCDLSVLYLAWHRADTCEEIEKPESSIELPVPPSLAKPSPALQEYMTFFNIQL